MWFVFFRGGVGMRAAHKWLEFRRVLFRSHRVGWGKSWFPKSLYLKASAARDGGPPFQASICKGVSTSPMALAAISGSRQPLFGAVQNFFVNLRDTAVPRRECLHSVVRPAANT